MTTYDYVMELREIDYFVKAGGGELLSEVDRQAKIAEIRRRHRNQPKKEIKSKLIVSTLPQ
jgi:hypothetical protein